MFLWVYLLIALFGGSGSALDQAAEAPPGWPPGSGWDPGG